VPQCAYGASRGGSAERYSHSPSVACFQRAAAVLPQSKMLRHARRHARQAQCSENCVER